MTDFDSTVMKAAGKAAKRVYPQYRRYVEPEDVQQEILLWAYGYGRRGIERALANGDEARVYRGAFTAARDYCRREQKQAVGPQLYDAALADEGELRDLVVLALTVDTRVATANLSDGTLAKIVGSVKRALDANPATADVLATADEDSEEYADALYEITEWLSGGSPATRAAA